MVTSPDKNIRNKRPHDSGFHGTFKNSYSRERIKKVLIRMLDSRDTCGRKPYPERNSCGFKNIRIRVDLCGLGLNETILENIIT